MTEQSVIENTIKMTGDVTIVRTNVFGEEVERHQVKNLVVTAGKNFIAASILKTTSNSPAAMTHMAIGTSSTAAAAGDTTLGAEVARVALASAVNTAGTNSITFTATFPANTPSTQQAIVEAGILNASTAGTMLCRTTFPVVTKQTGDSITITWVVTVN